MQGILELALLTIRFLLLGLPGAMQSAQYSCGSTD